MQIYSPTYASITLCIVFVTFIVFKNPFKREICCENMHTSIKTEIVYRTKRYVSLDLLNVTVFMKNLI